MGEREAALIAWFAIAYILGFGMGGLYMLRGDRGKVPRDDKRPTKGKDND